MSLHHTAYGASWWGNNADEAWGGEGKYFCQLFLVRIICWQNENEAFLSRHLKMHLKGDDTATNLTHYTFTYIYMGIRIYEYFERSISTDTYSYLYMYNVHIYRSLPRYRRAHLPSYRANK